MKKTNRLKSLDFLRGFIVLLMFIIHFYNNYFKIKNTENFILSLIDFVVFGFLMLIGVSVSYHYLGKLRDMTNKGVFIYFFKRALKIFIVYLIYSIAFLFAIKNDFSFDSIWRTIFLVKLNYNILILIPISFYILIIPLFIFVIRTNKIKKYYWFILMGIISYLISYKINYLPFDSSFRFLKSLLFGHMGWLNFPLFQWIFPYLLGISVGYYLKNTSESINKKGKKIILCGVLSLMMFIIGLVFRLKNNLDINITINKFPPTIYHFIYSIALCFIFLGIFLLIEKKSKLKLGLLIIFGQNSLIAYVSQWVFIWIFLFFQFERYINPYILSMITFILVYFVCKFNYRHRLL